MRVSVLLPVTPASLDSNKGQSHGSMGQQVRQEWEGSSEGQDEREAEGEDQSAKACGKLRYLWRRLDNCSYDASLANLAINACTGTGAAPALSSDASGRAARLHATILARRAVVRLQAAVRATRARKDAASRRRAVNNLHKNAKVRMWVSHLLRLCACTSALLANTNAT